MLKNPECGHCKRPWAPPVGVTASTAFCPHCSAERQAIAARQLELRPLRQEDFDGDYLLSREMRKMPSTRFSIRKINHRLHVLDGDSVCYSPPTFLQIPNRMALKELADSFNAKDTRSIDDILDFEAKYRRTKNKQARKNP